METLFVASCLRANNFLFFQIQCVKDARGPMPPTPHPTVHLEPFEGCPDASAASTSSARTGIGGTALHNYDEGTPTLTHPTSPQNIGNIKKTIRPTSPIPNRFRLGIIIDSLLIDDNPRNP